MFFWFFFGFFLVFFLFFFCFFFQGDRENGKCGHPLEFLLSDARPIKSDDPSFMKTQVLYRDINDRSHCMIRMGGLAGDQQYGASIASSNEIGLSAYSAMSNTTKTLESTPPLPPKFEPNLEDVTPSSITFTWTNSNGDGGSPVCGFVVIGAVKTITKLGTKKSRAAAQSNKTNIGKYSFEMKKKTSY